MSEFQVVVFELGGERYGLDIATVYEIIRRQPITAMPEAPASVEGVINLRGRIIPIVDLHRRFGVSGDAGQASRIVVAEASGWRVGLVVDGVSEVLMIRDDDIEPAPEIASSECYVRGIAKLEGCLVTLLDLDALFAAGSIANAA